MAGELVLRIFDVEHGACAILLAPDEKRIAMVDSGHNASTKWLPGPFIRDVLHRQTLDYLLVTNADQDHLSGLETLWTCGISVTTLHRNPSPNANTLRHIKQAQGELTDDIERFLKIHEEYIHPVPVPFDAGMGGVSLSVYHNSYPAFTDTNNLSAVYFIEFAGFKIIFPGDMEKAGWRALLADRNFTHKLAGTNILVASHHGRESGFCPEIFDHFAPDAVVISDKPIIHATQDMVPDYRDVIGEGVIVQGHTSRRHVLTTRRDGDIAFIVSPTGAYSVHTSKGIA